MVFMLRKFGFSDFILLVLLDTKWGFKFDGKFARMPFCIICKN